MLLQETRRSEAQDISQCLRESSTKKEIDGMKARENMQRTGRIDIIHPMKYLVQLYGECVTNALF